MTGTGDADLYVRVGSAPTTDVATTAARTRPARTRPAASRLAQPAPIHVMVRGYATATSTFKLVGKKL